MPQTTEAIDWEARLAAAIAPIFARDFATSDVAVGPFRVRLHQDAWAEQQEFTSAFLATASTGAADLEVAIVGGSNDPLADFVSERSRAGTSDAVDGCYAHWQATPAPVFYLYHPAARRGVMWIPESFAPHWLLAKPFLPLIHAFLAATSWAPVHAAAVGREGRFLLLGGPGHAGKSTAALACARDGWDYAGDDFVLVNPTLRTVAPMYVSGRVRAAGGNMFAELIERTMFGQSNEDDDPRFELRLNKAGSQAEVRGGRVAAIVVPRRRGETPFRFKPLRPFDVFRAILAVTAVQTPGLGESLTPKLLKLANMGPAFATDTGSDPALIPAALQRLLEQL